MNELNARGQTLEGYSEMVESLLDNKEGLTELLLSKMVVAKFGPQIRWNVSVGTWMVYDHQTGLWETDKGTLVVAKIRYVLEELRSMAVEGLKTGSSIRDSRISDVERASKRSFIDGAEKLMRSFETIHIDAKEFDADPMLLGLKGKKCIELKTQTAREIKPEDLLTKTTGCEFDPAASSDFWNQLVQQWTCGDIELAEYLQIWCGYSLTGLASDQTFLFLYGGGRNGKSVFVNALFRLMGDYADSLNATALMQRNGGNSHSTEIAKLIGTRMVICQELPDGQFFNETLMKNLTGEDVVTARHLYAKDVSFFSVIKLVMCGNHRPLVKGSDDGFWRRLRLLPFEAEIKDPDPKLNEKLKGQLPGILNWMLAGLKKYLEKGFIPVPSTVLQESSDYRSDMDLMQQWIQECLETDPNGKVPAQIIYESYKNWHVEKGFPAKSMNRFGDEFCRKTGAVKGRTSSSRIYTGYKIKTSEGVFPMSH